jgi:hypothetical protein
VSSEFLDCIGYSSLLEIFSILNIILLSNIIKIKKPMQIFCPFWSLEVALKGENNILNRLISAFHACFL